MTDIIELSFRRSAGPYEYFGPQAAEAMVDQQLKFEIPKLGVAVERAVITDAEVAPDGSYIDITITISRAVAAFMVEGAAGYG